MIAQRVLGRLLESGFEITTCLPGGDAFAAEARRRGVRTEAVGATLATLCREPCDWILSVLNTRILPADVIDHPARGVINFHDGPLPRFAGLFAPTRALLDGADEHGIAWHLVDEGIDTGDLLVTEPVPIEPDDTALTLQLRCVDAGCRSFERLLPLLRETDPQGRVQDPSLRTIFGSARWSRRGIETDWRSSVESIRRVVDAHDFGPYANYVGHPRFRFDGRWHLLKRVERCEDPECPNLHAEPGSAWTASDGRLHVRCGDACIVIRECDPPVSVRDGSRPSMVIRSDRELDAIEAWDAARFRFELGWRNRIDELGSNFAWPDDDVRSNFVLGERFEDLACGLIACHAIQDDDRIEFALGWRQDELAVDIGPEVDPAVTSLLHPFAPVSIPVEASVGIGGLVDRLTDAIAETRRRGPFLRDLLQRTGVGERSLLDPARLPIRVTEEERVAEDSPVAWSFHRSSEGTWSVSGPAWAMEAFQDLFGHRRRMLETTPEVSPATMPRVVGSTESAMVSWEGSQSIPRPRSFLDAVEARLQAADPEAILVDSTSDGGATDREMAELVQGWSTALRRAGVGPGDLVPVALDRGTPFVAVMFAVLGLGAGFVPLDPLAPDDRVRRMLEILGASVGVKARGRVMPGNSMTWIASPSSIEPSSPVLDRFACPEPDDVAFVLFTSGSTGTPRGVRLSHRNFDQYLEVVAEAIRPNAYEGSAWTSSVAFDSSVAEILYPVVHGGRVVVLERVDLGSAASLSRALLARKITGFGCATALWSAWMKYVAGLDDPIPGTLRHVDIGGSVADPGLVRRWLEMTGSKVDLMNRYGPTETTVTVTVHRIDSDSLRGKTIPIGRPERGTEMRILDDAGRRVPPGVVGEIWIGGAQVALGYLGTGDDQGGFQALAGADGRWFRTGDRGTWGIDGEIRFGGRADDQVKVGGFRVELDEVRQAIIGIDDQYVIEVLMIGDGVGAGLGVVVEAVATGTERDVWISRIKVRLESVLPRYAIPRFWRFVESIARTPSGKIDRPSARALFEHEDVDAPSTEPVGGPEWIADQVGRVLGRAVEDRSRSFFELGGDSLGAMRLHASLEAACGHPLPLTLVHAARDIDDLARRFTTGSSAVDADFVLNGHRRRRIVDTETGPTVLFLPGVHGEATLRHVWGMIGASATVDTIDLDLDRCRSIFDRDRRGEGFDRIVEEIAEMLLARGDPGSTVLVGYSIGGWLAFAVAANLLRRGIRIPAPLLIEPGIHVDGSVGERCRRRLDWMVDAFANLRRRGGVRRRLAPRPGDGGPVDPRDPRGRVTDDLDREFATLLLESLSSHRPEPEPIAVRLVTRCNRRRLFAGWWRLALGGVEHESVDLVEHEDFFRYGSEAMLAGVIERHLDGSEITSSSG